MKTAILHYQSRTVFLSSIALLCASLVFIFSSAHASMLTEYSQTESDSLRSFPKWMAVTSRTEEEMNSPASKSCAGATDTLCANLLAWGQLQSMFKNSSRKEQIEAVNTFVNKMPYIEDRNNWGKTDYWETPYEFFTYSGDCEDFSIAKYYTLKQMGVPEEDMRLIIVQDLNLGGIMHAVLEVMVDGTPYLLDNQAESVIRAEKVHHYKPIYAINETSWWAYQQ